MPTILRRINHLRRSLEKQVVSGLARKAPLFWPLASLSKTRDMDLAIRVLGTEFFRDDLQPRELRLDEIRAMLVLAPHQDDEAIGAGGTIALATQAGAKVVVNFLTDGLQAHLPYDDAESIRIREQEAREACEVVGAEYSSLSISNRSPAPTREDINALIDLIEDVNPDVILTPWVLDGPAKHRMANHLLWLANLIHPLPKCEVWGYQVHNTLYPNGLVDITSAADLKKEMLLSYRSQNEHSQCYDHLAMGMSAWNSRFMSTKVGSVERRYAEVFFVMNLSEHLSLVEDFYFDDLAKTYRGHRRVEQGMEAIHNELTRRPAG